MAGSNPNYQSIKIANPDYAIAEKHHLERGATRGTVLGAALLMFDRASRKAQDIALRDYARRRAATLAPSPT